MIYLLIIKGGSVNSNPIEQFKSKPRETWTMGNFGEMAVSATRRLAAKELGHDLPPGFPHK
jgi:hypothetical protein